MEEREERELFEICRQHFYRQEPIIPKNNFKFILQLANSDVFDIIFEIFGRWKENSEIITFDDMKYFYFCFKSENPKIKSVLIALKILIVFI